MAKKNKYRMLDIATGWLVVIGAVNWGLEVLDLNLVEMLANATTTALGTIVYSLVGLSGAYVLVRAIMKKYMK
jgi:uncharacterized membrane protein YuzA (DUF378 family)